MSERGEAQGYQAAPTRTITVEGAAFAYRDLGPRAVLPLVARLILAGSGPAGGPGLVDMTRVTVMTVFQNHRAFVAAARAFLRR